MEAAKRFCEQCDRRVSPGEEIRCGDEFCGLKPNRIGIFPNAPKNLHIRQASRARQGRPDRPLSTLDIFAEYLSEHDLETGDKGGDVPKVAAKMGIDAQYANALLQRIRRIRGWQAQ